MCGIAGSLDRHGRPDRAVVDAQLETMLHRGPDSWGVFESGPAHVGQTRLAIIDVEHGDPPVTDEDGRVGVALNGEIYNFQALRDELRAGGHSFASRVDTEVLAHLAEDLEPVALARRLHGMFAFAIWDERRGRLTLGRDRLGKKPLYYWAGDDTFVFASEIKGLLAHPAVSRRLDLDAIPAYLTFGYVPSPRTFFTGIRSVPPGHVMTVDTDLHIELSGYWEPQIPGAADVAPLDLSLDEAAREVRRRLGDAVRRRLVADVPLGAFLSGGIDSSSVVALMSEAMSEPVRTFTIGFEDRHGFDEREYARLVAERFGTEHVEFVVKPEAVDLVERLVWHHDQPFGDSSAVPTFLLSELTRKHVTVALAGDGSDELFAGYERFAAALAVDRYRRLPLPLRRAVARTVGTLPRTALRGRVGSVQRFLRHADAGLPSAYLDWVSYVTPQWRHRLAGDSGGAWDLTDYEEIFDQTRGADLLGRLLAVNLRTYLLDDLLPKVDRMSMAHGLEVRSPFLDHELVEFALRLPREVRLRGFSLKRVLRAAVADVIPPQIIGRRKHGFGVPLDRWFREDLAGYTRAMLGGRSSRVGQYLDARAIEELRAEHESGIADHGHALWALLTLEVFLRRQDGDA